MNCQQMLDDLEQQISADGLPRKDRWLLLSWMSAELNEISGKADWDWNLVYLDPAIMTRTGEKQYLLPENFGSNFSRFADDDADSYACKLDDGTSQGLLTYKSPKQFFSRDLKSVSNSKPSDYTVTTDENGRRVMWLYPPPDANGSVGYYLVAGLYPQTEWRLDEMRGLPAIPGNSAALRYGVLRRLNRATYEPLYQDALMRLMINEAQNRRGQLIPVMNQDQQRTHYDVYGGRSL